MKLSKFFVISVAMLAVGLIFGCQPPPSINICQKTTDCNTPPAEGVEWVCDDGGATAKITLIELDADDTTTPPTPPMLAMVLAGTAPTPALEYKLVIYTEPYPSMGITCLADVTSEADGTIEAEGAYIGNDLTDAKIFLVPAADVTCSNFMVSPPVIGQMTAWSCDDNMFEATLADDLVTYDSPLDDVPAP